MNNTKENDVNETRNGSSSKKDSMNGQTQLGHRQATGHRSGTMHCIELLWNTILNVN